MEDDDDDDTYLQKRGCSLLIPLQHLALNTDVFVQVLVRQYSTECSLRAVAKRFGIHT